MKDKSIEILNKDKCSGCNACVPICPTNAIEMKYNEEGFLYPIVDYDKCTNCGLCSKICPELNFTFSNKKEPECYAMEANDDIRKVSSSGGIFTILSDYVFDKGGYVCGAAFDKNWEVEHIIINDRKDLYKLRGSKYVQSNKQNTFREIKNLLNNDQWVLFSGCPCEVAGLKNYLRKDYDKLILVDLICGSVQPPVFWKQYLTEKSKNKIISNVSFRDKSSYGWGLQLNIYFSDGSSYKKQEWEDIFTKSYSSKIVARKSCLTCSFASLPRVGDITIADFWNIDRYDNKKYAEKSKSLGTSLILSNNDKGKIIIDHVNNVRKNIKLFDEIPLNFIKNTCNFGIFEKRNRKIELSRREAFYDAISKGKSFEEATNYAIGNYADVGVLNFCAGNNYGAILTSYSVLYSIKKLGYLPKIISYIAPHVDEKNYFTKKFHKKYLIRTKNYRSKFDLYELNNYMDTFVVGSDQVFAHLADFYWNRAIGEKFGVKNIFYLSFANLEKNLISFASSYGHNEYKGDYKNRLMTSYDLSRFDHISVREDDGVRLCKELFDIDADQVIEPVYLLDNEEWDRIISDSSLTHKGKLAYYLLDENEDKRNAIEYISKKLNLEPIDASNNLKNEVEDFLYIIKNADFVITDSFHGTCFSSIFKKQFISFVNKTRGLSRYKLFEKLGLSDRLLENFEELKNNSKLIDKNIDYHQMDVVVSKEKERAINWLKNALSTKKDKKVTYEKKMIEYLTWQNDNLNLKLRHCNNIIENLNNLLESSSIDESNKISQNLNILLKNYNVQSNSQINNLGKQIENIVNTIAWWIPIKKLRDNFRNKMLNKK